MSVSSIRKQTPDKLSEHISVPPTKLSVNVHHITIFPKVAMLINQCKAKRQDFRIILDTDPQTKEDYKRMTIVVNKDGTYIKNFYG